MELAAIIVGGRFDTVPRCLPFWYNVSNAVQYHYYMYKEGHQL